MPVEIRELIIKTEIAALNRQPSAEINEQEMETMKKELMDACKKIISENLRKHNYKR